MQTPRPTATRSNFSHSPPALAEQRLSALTSLLESLEAPAAPPPPPPPPAPPPTVERSRAAEPQPAAEVGDPYENRLVQVRLGLASSLFLALRAKHPATAAHSLRVALGCSAWSFRMQLSEDERDHLEVAALLHDIGKIGVADSVLLKPGRLTGEEYRLMKLHTAIGLGILGGCCASTEVVRIVEHASAWYDGSRPGYEFLGDDLPLGARMLAIVDAYDSMTTDQVFRRAMSRERALAELFEHVGTQFDGNLVREFCLHLEGDGAGMNLDVVRHWLRELEPAVADRLWERGSTPVASPAAQATPDADPFYRRLLECMHDAVLFVDTQLQVRLWNRAAERLTGISAASIRDTQFSPTLVNLRDERGRIVDDTQCPVAHAISSGVQSLRRMELDGRGGTTLNVDFHVAPVVGPTGEIRGATVLLHDASSQITLEERVQALHEKATRDPLTKVSNRAEFDRVHAEFVGTHLEAGVPCSLIICDIDHFKSINDTYGHQAGDETLISFASLLQRNCRTGDLVARYGGEEFVMLCADCDNATATGRAEEIRRQLASTPQSALSGRCITSSFGVTEIQDGDSAETMLRRADRALYQAKENGRNMVVQLGAGLSGGVQRAAPRKSWWWFRRAEPDQLIERTLLTAVPLKIAVEKLRGFVADHFAQLTAITEDTVSLHIDGQSPTLLRRSSDRAVPFVIELRFEEERASDPNGRSSNDSRTLIRVVVRPKRGRDRRRRDVAERARQLLISLKSYLMAHEYMDSTPVAEREEEDGVLKKVFTSLFVK